MFRYVMEKSTGNEMETSKLKTFGIGHVILLSLDELEKSEYTLLSLVQILMGNHLACMGIHQACMSLSYLALPTSYLEYLLNDFPGVDLNVHRISSLLQILMEICGWMSYHMMMLVHHLE